MLTLLLSCLNTPASVQANPSLANSWHSLPVGSVWLFRGMNKVSAKAQLQRRSCHAEALHAAARRF